jgi:hypothetical protein
MAHSLSLRVIQSTLAIVRLPPGSDLPWWAEESGEFLSLTRTPDETSVVCDARRVPESVRAERSYRGLRVEGTVPFEATGVLASLAVPLADAGVPIFVISTYDTDYLLVPESWLTTAIDVLRGTGHSVTGH